MRIIRAATIGDAQLTASNVAETDYAEWDAVTTYAKGDRRMVTTAGVHRCYESLIDSNLNKPPQDNLTGDTPAWLDLGPTNRWALFDAQVGTLTSNAEYIEVTITPGLVNALALLGLDAATVQVTVTDPLEGVVYSKTVDLVSDEGVGDWYDYFFEPIKRRSDLVLFDLPAYADASVTVRINQPGGTAICGGLVLGRQRFFGGVRTGAALGITDYSRKERDQWGRPVIVERGFAKRASVELLVDRGAVDAVHQTLSAHRAQPLVWAFAEHAFSSSIIYGYYRDFSIVIQYLTHSVCTLEIEGLAT